MVLDAVSNFVRGNTDASVGTSDTTVSVADASIFPDPATDGEFNVVIWDVNNFPRPDQDGDVEILRVTERDTTADELTVTRGQEITSAAAHPEGSAIHLSPTAKMFSDIESTFGDFWDAGTQELTADVNNTNTTTQSLEAGELKTPTTTPSQLDADRSFDTVYQNTTEHILFVTVTVLADSSDEDLYLIPAVSETSDPSITSDRVGRWRVRVAASNNRVTVQFIVGPNQYYETRNVSSNGGLDTWTEIELGA